MPELPADCIDLPMIGFFGSDSGLPARFEPHSERATISYHFIYMGLYNLKLCPYNKNQINEKSFDRETYD